MSSLHGVLNNTQSGQARGQYARILNTKIDFFRYQMSHDPEEIREPEAEKDAKPAIAVAEKDSHSDGRSMQDNEAKPTITIAEKTDGESAADAVDQLAAPADETPINTEDVSYQAVEKEGSVTAIWEMHGQKHLRTIDPRSSEGKQILALFETAG